MKGLCDIIRP